MIFVLSISPYGIGENHVAAELILASSVFANPRMPVRIILQRKKRELVAGIYAGKDEDHEYYLRSEKHL